MAIRHKVTFLCAVSLVIVSSRMQVNGQPTPASKSESAPKSELAVQALKDSADRNAKIAKEYQTAIDSATAAYIEEARKNQSELISSLEQARKAATAADKLDEAVRLRDMIRDFEKMPITPPVKETGKQERRKLEVEIDRLKSALAKKEAAQKLHEIKELSKALVNTKWQWLGRSEVIEFQGEGKAFGWAKDPGTWSVDPEGTILIKWSSGHNWTMHVNSGFSGAVSVTDKGEGTRLKLVR